MQLTSKYEAAAIGTFFLLSGLYLFAGEIVNLRKDLVEVRGAVEQSSIEYLTIPTRYGGSSIKSILHFKLEEHSFGFTAIENIGSDKRNERFEEICRRLIPKQGVVVQVRPDRRHDRYAIVYGLRLHDSTVLITLNESKHKAIFGLTVTIALSLYMMYMYYMLDKSRS